MPLVLKCKCGRVYRVSRKHAGHKATCLGCGRTLVVPAAAQRSKSGSRKAAAPHGAAPWSNAPRRGSFVEFLEEELAASSRRLALPGVPACPACHGPLAPVAVVCVDCGYDIRIGKRRRTEVF